MNKCILISGIFILIVLSGCGRKESSAEMNRQLKGSKRFFVTADSGRVFETTSTGVASTDYIFDLKKVKLPLTFRFDSIQTTDSARRAEYCVYTIKGWAPRYRKFNEMLYRKLTIQIIREQILLETTNSKEPYYTKYWYELGPFELYANEKLISLCCLIDTYSHGGNHHNYTWCTFNYDLKNESVIEFSDLFSLKGKKDTLAFNEAIQSHLKPGGCYDQQRFPVDFSFVKNGIVINPELSWACGMPRAFFGYGQMDAFLTKEGKRIAGK